MPRATNAPASRQRRKKILKLAKGYRGTRKNIYRVAQPAVDRAGQNAYNDRRRRKRDFRRLWITRISAAARGNGISYSRLMQGLKLAGVDVNRKMLADIAATDEDRFNEIVGLAKAKLDASP